MSYFSSPTRWRIAAGVFDVSIAEMANDGRLGREGTTLWLGREEGDQIEVTHVVTLSGASVWKARDQLVIGASVMNAVTDFATREQLYLVGQIHSHAPGYGTDLSYADKTYGISVPGILSLVAPDFAQRPKTAIADCGVHIYEPDAGWRRMDKSEVQDRIEMSDSSKATVLKVN